MTGLFPGEQFESADAARPALDVRVVGVAVQANVWGDFDYAWPGALGEPFVGQRVRVQFGRGGRTILGFVVEVDRVHRDTHKLKPVSQVVDQELQFSDDLWELAQWISQYYMTPLGVTLAGCVPTAVGQSVKRAETVVFLGEASADLAGHWPKSLGVRQRKALDELLEARKQGVEPLTMEALRHHSGIGRDSIKRLILRDMVRTESRPVTLESLQGQLANEDPFPLNSDQQTVLDSLLPKLAGGFSTTLLHGVTGSGKTEVYVRAIREVIAQGKQAILLAPEIALATQTLQRLATRLPRVAVLHSGLTNAQRAFHWEQIRSGQASVVIGPRSAIFAPTPNLGLVIVDEEHESSYKQDTAPRYHGRDVAVMRAKLAAVPVVLGSATPSMESYHNAQTGRYDLLTLPSRVRGLAMPTLKIVPLRKEMTRGRIELVGQTLTNKIAETLDKNEQAILLLNRRGYASYVFCPSCQWMHQCDDCERPLVWHQAIQLMVCHHCHTTRSLPEVCPACSGKIVLFGYGIQRIEDELARKFSLARVARMDSDTMTSPKQFQKVLGDFAAGDVDILLGTQMVAKGLDFPKVSLVGVVSADTSLGLKDFRASERTFQLIVQVAGRAGRGDTPGSVVVQTLFGDEPAIQFAQSHDYRGFALHELAERKEAAYPPYGRMVRFIVRHEKIETAAEGAETLGRFLQAHLPAHGVRTLGPQQAEFARIRRQFRFDILLMTDRPGLIQQKIGPILRQASRETPADILVDVDPMNLF